MAKIRDDLVGVVDAGNVTGDGRLSLKAGDTVPEGVSVGDHVLAEEKPSKPAEEEKPKRGRRPGNSERGE
jgi:hypothetical protein